MVSMIFSSMVGGGGGGGHKMETFSMEKMEKPLSNSPFMPFYAMNFDHRIKYVAAYFIFSSMKETVN